MLISTFPFTGRLADMRPFGAAGEGTHARFYRLNAASSVAASVLQAAGPP